MEGILENIPQVLTYIIPGFTSLIFYTAFSAKKQKNEQHTILISILWSYIINIAYRIFSRIAGCLFPSIAGFFSNEIVTEFTSIVFALIFGLIIVKFPKKVKDKLIKIINRHLESGESVWQKAMEANDGAWATVFLNNDIVYCGEIANYTIDPDDDRKELILKKYSIAIRKKDDVNSAADFLLGIEDHSDEDSFVYIDCHQAIAIEIKKDSCSKVRKTKRWKKHR